jgi:hypothetical protein
VKTINFLRGGTDEKLKIIGVRSFLDRIGRSLRN